MQKEEDPEKTEETEDPEETEFSHEIFHALSYTGVPVSRLEEGLATRFSREFMRSLGCYEPIWLKDGEYEVAKSDVDNLLRIDPETIKKARKIQPVISMITKDDLLNAHKPEFYELAEKLCKPFYN